MTVATQSIYRVYHQPLWGRTDLALRRALIGASLVGAVVLLAIFIAPAPAPEPTTLEEMPERFARLILEKPQPAESAPAAQVQARSEVIEAVAQPEPEVAQPAPQPRRAPVPRTEPRRRAERPVVAKDTGTEGRERAKEEVVANLSEVSKSLDQALDGIAQALPAAQKSADADAQAAPNRRRGRERRAMRSGRSSEQLTKVADSSDLATADLSGSTIVAQGVAIASIDAVTSPGGASGAGGAAGATGGSGSSRAGYSSDGELRSNESLLAVVRRYAPGIQFCYENELKKNPGLRGKLVISLTVLASGEVSEAKVVEDGLGSAAVTRCVLAQIHDWRFPAIERGMTTFKTPFVFTPPE